jgi:hypothetical protein
MSHLPPTLQAVTDYCYNFRTYSGYLTNRFCRYSDVFLALRLLSVSNVYRLCVWRFVFGMLRRDNLQIKFETTINICLSIRRNIPEQISLQLRRCENLESGNSVSIWDIYPLVTSLPWLCKAESKHMRLDYLCVYRSFIFWTMETIFMNFCFSDRAS